MTHTVLGACMGEALMGKKAGKKALLWGALAANLPDVDVVTMLWQDIPDQLCSHRGFTHSILFCLMVPPVLSWFLERKYRSTGIRYSTWLVLWLLGLFSHIGIDSLTNYGTAWFEPFSHYRVMFNTIFVADPFYTIWLLTAALALLILKKSSRFRKPYSVAGMVISSLYLVFTFFNKVHVNDVFRDNLAASDIRYSRFITTPTPLNNFLWYDLAQVPGGFYIGYYSIFDSGRDMDLHFIPANDSLLGDLVHDKGIRKLISFSQGYYHISKPDSGVLAFHDMRFGQLGGWHDAGAPFVFTYEINPDVHQEAVINRGRMEAVSQDEFHKLVHRIRGH